MQIKLTPQEAHFYLRVHFGVDSSVQIIIEGEAQSVPDTNNSLEKDDIWFVNNQDQGVAPPCLKLDDEITAEFSTGVITTGYASDWDQSWNTNRSNGRYITRWKYGWN